LYAFIHGTLNTLEPSMDINQEAFAVRMPLSFLLNAFDNSFGLFFNAGII
jgi:hypothetical protein